MNIKTLTFKKYIYIMQNFQRQHVPKFIHKILKMIEKYPDSINWSQDGIDLFILKQDHFREVVMLQFFRNCNLGSFIRQLNIYGFSKISWHKKILKFRHQFFKRGEQQNYQKIIRRKKQNSQKKDILLSKEEQIQIYARQNFQQSLIDLPDLFNILFNFRNNYEQELRYLKTKIYSLNREINRGKNKKLKPLIDMVKENMSHSFQLIQKLNQKVKQFDLNQKVPKRQQHDFNQSQIENNVVKLETDYQNNLVKLEADYTPVLQQNIKIQHTEAMANQLLSQKPNCKNEDEIPMKIIEFQSISKFVSTG